MLNGLTNSYTKFILCTMATCRFHWLQKMKYLRVSSTRKWSVRWPTCDSKWSIKIMRSSNSTIYLTSMSPRRGCKSRRSNQREQQQPKWEILLTSALQSHMAMIITREIFQWRQIPPTISSRQQDPNTSKDSNLKRASINRYRKRLRSKLQLSTKKCWRLEVTTWGLKLWLMRRWRSRTQ